MSKGMEIAVPGGVKAGLVPACGGVPFRDWADRDA